MSRRNLNCYFISSKNIRKLNGDSSNLFETSDCGVGEVGDTQNTIVTVCKNFICWQRCGKKQHKLARNASFHLFFQIVIWAAGLFFLVKTRQNWNQLGPTIAIYIARRITRGACACLRASAACSQEDIASTWFSFLKSDIFTHWVTVTTTASHIVLVKTGLLDY